MRELRILLVEDNPSDVRLVREAMKESRAKIKISVAGDGVEAMEYLHRAAENLDAGPDLVLLDLNLPRKNGREVLAEIKGSSKLSRLPVVVMTSSQADDDIENAYRLNANCYVTKPSDLNEYVSVVRSIENFWLGTASLPDAFPGSSFRLGRSGFRPAMA